MLSLNYKYADMSVIGENNGLDIKKEFDDYRETISSIVKSLYENKDVSGKYLQWMNSGYSEETVWYVKEYAALVENRFDNILVLGIGGSALGTLAVTEALLKPYWNYLPKEKRNNYPKIFFLDNIDPDEITRLLEVLDLSKTLVNVVTKSGDTTETVAQFMIIKNIMYNLLGDDYRKNIIATTDKHTGVLRQIAEQEGYKTFIIPDDVSGRFSVFTAVGLLPFALLGIDIDEIIKGVQDMDSMLRNPDINANIAAQNALLHYLFDRKKGKNVTVVMPYSSRLKYVADWFVQLWAESLGKEKNLNNEVVNCGLTPVKALGATDQYSQMQLCYEGPSNKLINFICVDKFDNELVIPEIFEYTGIGYLGGKSVQNLLNSEMNSSRVVLSDFNKPSITINIPEITPYFIAQLLYFFEMQTAITALLYNIDAYNQPAVENARNYTYALMGRRGYEDSANSLKEKLDRFLTN